MNLIIVYVLIGLAGGALSGLLGIGGATLIIPALIYILGFQQHLAQGTTLALMVPPIGLLAAWTYYKSGNTDIRVAAFICLGFFLGGLFGAKIAHLIPQEFLKKIFGFFMLLVSVHMILGR
ncbi:MAG: sulfite exporter TauE/SafE family protein [Candidatus Omnitrophica bacterium]|nr:sulfite exporter TauE/SafE family protein [Candidatus Omnitrophota bacterium]